MTELEEAQAVYRRIAKKYKDKKSHANMLLNDYKRLNGEAIKIEKEMLAAEQTAYILYKKGLNVEA